MTMPCDQVKVWPAMVVCGVGAAATRSGEPTVVEEVKSVRTSFATRTAPSTLASPARCSKVLEPASCCDAYIRIALARFGVSFGLACKIRATAPETTGVAIEVPERYIWSRADEPETLGSR